MNLNNYNKKYFIINYKSKKMTLLILLLLIGGLKKILN